MNRHLKFLAVPALVIGLAGCQYFPVPTPGGGTTTTTTKPPVVTTTTKPPVTTTKVPVTTTTKPPVTTTTKPPVTTTTAPAPVGHFNTLAPGSALPSEDTCAALVRKTAEKRPENATPNAKKGVGANSTYPRVTGNFVGTTDEIIQWAACKWGIDEDMVRAQVAQESSWRQSEIGDNGESFGLGQVRVGYHDSAFVNNNAKLSSAYNLDYTYGYWRDCFEGNMTWHNTVERGSTYAAGDAWGCFGSWFAGRWHTAPANDYINKVKALLAQRWWESPNF